MDGVNALREQFNACGPTVEKQTDITANVLTALRLDNARKLELIDAWIPRGIHRPFRVFAGIAGTRNYAGLEHEKVRYLSAQLATSSPAGAQFVTNEPKVRHRRRVVKRGDHCSTSGVWTPSIDVSCVPLISTIRLNAIAPVLSRLRRTQWEAQRPQERWPAGPTLGVLLAQGHTSSRHSASWRGARHGRTRSADRLQPLTQPPVPGPSRAISPHR